jgi:hypothetical protein
MPTFRLVTASAKYGSRKIKLSVEMEEHRPCAKKQQNLVPWARLERIATFVSPSKLLRKSLERGEMHV